MKNAKEKPKKHLMIEFPDDIMLEAFTDWLSNSGEQHFLGVIEDLRYDQDYLEDNQYIRIDYRACYRTDTPIIKVEIEEE